MNLVSCLKAKIRHALVPWRVRRSVDTSGTVRKQRLLSLLGEKPTIIKIWRHIGLWPLRMYRRSQLYHDELQNVFNLSRNISPRIFNLDLHIGVIADLAQEFSELNIPLTRWSISAHNHLVQGRLPVSDPVRFINQKFWRELGPDVIGKFQSRYSRFLKTFDGYVCTYPPTFAELYGVFQKPILIVAATRYEAPYTARPDDWARFNDFLIDGVNRKQILIAANNSGDADYLTFFTGLKPQVVPSLCHKASFGEAPNEFRFILGRDSRLVHSIETASGNNYRRLSSPYKWETLAGCVEVLVFPQNISTMTLFELATAGVPVAVPSRHWIKELRKEGSQVLDECSFYELENLPVTALSEDNPNNYRSAKYLDWWLDRADFLDNTLMPNVRIVNSIDELMSRPSLTQGLNFLRGHNSIVETRNSHLRQQRQTLVREFISRL